MSLQALISVAMSGGLLLGAMTAAVASPNESSEQLLLSRREQAQTLYQQGVLQYEKGDLEAAIALYTESLELDPNSAITYSARAGAWGQQGDNTAAIADYSAAIAIDDDLAAAYGGRGLALSLEGDYTSGVNDLWTAAQLFRQQNQLAQYTRTLNIIKNIAP
ncbi:MAG: tetratricopeptide repeat protein [Leptolyngbya sp. SIOISBB]|nr:tetratricopeptide repeat protein [Leptolyngbya sp. SIOISBB]